MVTSVGPRNSCEDSRRNENEARNTSVGSSHRLRNPENAAPDWLVPLIDGYASGGERLPQTVALGEGRAGYAEPITVEPVCLTCHGVELDDAIAAQLAALYPEDQATGFSAGDFRGVFWVEF